ncbi:MAG: ECF transporter S component [Lachnospiraceae bacterium]|nr:ECF transporter S component [Lachnospiraceae bacterium]
MKNNKTKTMTLVGMLCAIAYVVMVIGRIPIVLFLKYEPKDVIITIGGFLLGPIYAFIISTIVSFIEMFSVSDTGIIGCIMNIISSCSFACTAAVIYKKRHNVKGAIIGLLSGFGIMVIIMLMWNYYITPIYMGYPREAIAKMLLPAFLPFNLIKGGINAAVTFLLYRPVVNTLCKAGLIDSAQQLKTENISKRRGATLIGSLILASCVFGILVLQGII